MFLKSKSQAFLVCCIAYTLISSTGFSQTGKYFIKFTDKKKSPYNISNPQEFLSQRSIDRRNKQNISLSDRDIPVNPAYIDSLKNIGVNVWFTSRWMNAALIETDAITLEKVKSLSIVSGNIKGFDKVNARNSQNKILKSGKSIGKTRKKHSIKRSLSPKDYGSSLTQVSMIGADKMHEKGFTGQGMRVAIFDAGFKNANKVPCLQHLFTKNKILATYDFVYKENSVYEDDSHGLQVLSTMAGYQLGDLIGTAYEADYILLKTEDTRSEYRIEEINWLLAAEYADSAGVDVINSSLGYNLFSNSKMDYTQADMNGKTAFCTIAAEMAASVGMLVVSSAGNEGDDNWQIITAPADADSILSIGAVDGYGNHSGFSSKGYTADGRVKPDLCTMGSGTVLSSSTGSITTSSGTSFSSPLMAGLATGFWQAHPEMTNQQIIKYLKRSASQFNKPDIYLGYGIPNFDKAEKLILIDNLTNESKYKIIPNPTDLQQITLYLDKLFVDETAVVQLVDMSGKVVLTKNIKLVQENVISFPNKIASGLYILNFYSNNLKFSEKIVKQ